MSFDFKSVEVTAPTVCVHGLWMCSGSALSSGGIVGGGATGLFMCLCWGPSRHGGPHANEAVGGRMPKVASALGAVHGLSCRPRCSCPASASRPFTEPCHGWRGGGQAHLTVLGPALSRGSRTRAAGAGEPVGALCARRQLFTEMAIASALGPVCLQPLPTLGCCMHRVLNKRVAPCIQT